MTETAIFEPGGYRYVRGPFQYSGGVVAEVGFALERVRFQTPLPLEEGFARIESHLDRIGRPYTSFAACELRSPEPFSEQGFIDFNRVYVGTLERWGLFKDEENPVARSNVCPEIDAPPEPSFHAFSYTVPAAADQSRSFVIAGSAESPEGGATYEERIIRLGETSEDALLEKAQYVIQAMEKRMSALDVGWEDATVTHAYTVHDLHPFLGDELVSRGAADAGLTWVYARPPVIGLEYEMDVRGVHTEYVMV
ncbi:MAG: hypothetical protein CFH41_02185 [Alphaproteobacteria bacterium MarineAlpha11_Bin1]|nr:MAG: hypothetical protein CFH41_02185 [Alphaproteobacteria bacterium MarineAlpha11_Bin1]|tara:strand:+ start:1638 stop:2393 length:756 start_codon:yes stop_codon:yes gene_type:complete